MVLPPPTHCRKRDWGVRAHAALTYTLAGRESRTGRTGTLLADFRARAQAQSKRVPSRSGRLSPRFRLAEGTLENQYRETRKRRQGVDSNLRASSITVPPLYPLATNPPPPPPSHILLLLFLHSPLNFAYPFTYAFLLFLTSLPRTSASIRRSVFRLCFCPVVRRGMQVIARNLASQGRQFCLFRCKSVRSFGDHSQGDGYFFSASVSIQQRFLSASGSFQKF